MDKLSSLLPAALRRRGLHSEFTAGFVVLKAEEWLKHALPAHATTLKVLSFVDGILTIQALHSIALQECVQRSGALKKALQDLSPKIVIKDVRVLRS